MNRVKRYVWLLALLMIVTLSGCGGSNSNTGTPVDPLPTQDISGVWIGSIGDTFAVGIITQDDVAQFVGDTSLFISPSSSDPLHVTANSAIFSGNLDFIEWDTDGSDYQCTASQSGTVISTAATNSTLGFPFGLSGGGIYSIADQNLTFIFLYNNAYDETPDVNDLIGDWEIQNAWTTGNTLTLTISAGNPNISGDDELNNHFEGTISIHTSSPQKNVYGVSLQLTNTAVPLPEPIQLDGLATFVSSYEQGATTKTDTLVIGAIDADKTYFLSGFAAKLP
jgi:hypothetical protein